jgi:hypothetical protein
MGHDESLKRTLDERREERLFKSFNTLSVLTNLYDLKLNNVYAFDLFLKKKENVGQYKDIRGSALKAAVQARYLTPTPSDIGMGVIYCLSSRQIMVALHTRNGTALKTYNFLRYNIEYFSEVIQADVNEALGINQSVLKRPKCTAYISKSDPAISDLIYGYSSIYTNADTLRLHGSEFAIYDVPYKKKVYAFYEKSLKYSPILIINAFRYGGLEYDFISIMERTNRAERNKIPYFLMKDRTLLDKYQTLRMIYPKEKISAIAKPQDRAKMDEAILNNNDNNFHLIYDDLHSTR